MADESERNEATEIVDGKVETVEVSKHPEATIPETDLSLADIERGRSHPVRWAVYAAAVLVAIIAPYWYGRALAVNDTAWLTMHLDAFTPQGMAFLSWTVTLTAIAMLGVAIVDSGRWIWRILFAIGLAAEQFVAGVALLRLDFWYSTYVVYGESATIANAANLGIIAAGFGVAVFAVIWVGLLVVIRKESPLNVLTRSWASFILFFAIEAAALLVVMFGGLLTTVAA
ncbi:membrane protein [Bifidobacterium stellenboschense]|uniref:Teichoic acid transporter n=1 Tax=Bifidobacterium stellenboschense TaxID=762211 RepID=A0A087DP50_9BIFI|nr:membrane protein [Bifidobacterium stellenboschense]KFI97300.1 teichoic acid transporter [Bifidobacterium stellenboschense]